MAGKLRTSEEKKRNEAKVDIRQAARAQKKRRFHAHVPPDSHQRATMRQTQEILGTGVLNRFSL
jgi:hypothetical protein